MHKRMIIFSSLQEQGAPICLFPSQYDTWSTHQAIPDNVKKIYIYKSTELLFIINVISNFAPAAGLKKHSD